MLWRLDQRDASRLSTEKIGFSQPQYVWKVVHLPYAIFVIAYCTRGLRLVMVWSEKRLFAENVHWYSALEQNFENLVIRMEYFTWSSLISTLAREIATGKIKNDFNTLKLKSHWRSLSIYNTQSKTTLLEPSEFKTCWASSEKISESM